MMTVASIAGDVVRSVRARVLALADDEASFARRGFMTDSADARARLEHVGRVFIHGYNAALCSADATDELNDSPLSDRGFAYEGAAMACALLDALLPVRAGRWRRLLRDGAGHVYMLHVGAGWALARLRRPLPRSTGAFDPVLRWLVADGYGFHEGYFAPRRLTPHRRVRGYALRAYDQGLGRSLWFSRGASPVRIASAIASVPAERAADLWSGAGLAAAYAGGCSEAALRELREAGGPHRAQLGQGAAFAVSARARAGNPAEHTDLACAVLAGVPPARAVTAVDAALARSVEGPGTPRYEAWRAATRHLLTPEGVPA
jgi:hypothetical protein